MIFTSVCKLVGLSKHEIYHATLHTGNLYAPAGPIRKRLLQSLVGDGEIFLARIDDAIRIRNDDRGENALELENICSRVAAF
jgi:nitrogen regulatory protein PII